MDLNVFSNTCLIDLNVFSNTCIIKNAAILKGEKQFMCFKTVELQVRISLDGSFSLKIQVFCMFLKTCLLGCRFGKEHYFCCCSLNLHKSSVISVFLQNF